MDQSKDHPKSPLLGIDLSGCTIQQWYKIWYYHTEPCSEDSSLVGYTTNSGIAKSYKSKLAWHPPGCNNPDVRVCYHINLITVLVTSEGTGYPIADKLADPIIDHILEP